MTYYAILLFKIFVVLLAVSYVFAYLIDDDADRMTNKAYTYRRAVECLLFSLTAPFIVPIALIFTKRTDVNLPRAFAWYDTPDEDDLFDLNEPQIAWTYKYLGWFMTAWSWLGFRNRGHGFTQLFSREAPAKGFVYDNPYSFFIIKQWLWFRFEFGWRIYHSTKYETKFEYRPILAIKIRRRVA